MAQLYSYWVRPEDMIRSRAWRMGYESYRLGEPPDYLGPRAKSLAYEYGRLTAAYLIGEGVRLRRVTPTRPVNDAYVPDLAAALERAVVASAC
ncbi:MAG: hypothetical protein AAF641_05185 [Pseudomonadota bacterium]